MKMEFRYLGNAGLKVSELCLGAMTFGRETAEKTSYQMMDQFQAAGGNFIDTANVYSQGLSETIVGRWLKDQDRESIVLATKVRFPMGPGPNQEGLSRSHIIRSLEASLKRLQTDYIDLYQVHMWDVGTPIEETLRTLDSLVQQGKVRYIGASNFTAWQLQKAVDYSAFHGLERFSCLQPLYNLLDRTIEWDLLEVCRNEGIGVIPWSPLRGGWLTGKYHRGMQAPPADTRIKEATKKGWSEAWDQYATERTWKILEAVQEMAEKYEKSPAQVSLRWLLQQPGVTAPIIGARTLEHLQANLGAVGWVLSPEDLTRLNEVSEPERPYPYSFHAWLFDMIGLISPYSIVTPSRRFC
jgi:aryl-alcohol dehydrogenase-like predicted oxidoreductase